MEIGDFYTIPPTTRLVLLPYMIAEAVCSQKRAKKLAEAKNSRASKDETLNKLNIKAVEDSHLDDSSDTSCL